MATIDDLADLIAEEMKVYSEEVTEKVKKAVEVVGKEVNKEIKNKITFKQRSGDYVKAFRVKTVYEDQFNLKKAWYVANGEHRLTHLLEFGHAVIGGDRADAFPHIVYGDELAKRRMEELVEEAVKE